MSKRRANASVLLTMPIAETVALSRNFKIKAMKDGVDRFYSPKVSKSSPRYSLQSIIKFIKSHFPIFFRMFKDIEISFNTTKDNPKNKKTNISESDLEELESRLYALGISDIHYIKIPRIAIFRKLAIPYPYGIIVTMEINHNSISKAPSLETQIEVFNSHYRLGDALNQIAAIMRKMGYNALAGHPLGGLTLYQYLEEFAGAGYHGRHGIIINPKHGPRHRIAAIYTDIENLPINQNVNKHKWIESYCNSCKRCISKCPSGAIYENPIVFPNGLRKHIDSRKCTKYFLENYGCTICLKECIFNNRAYEEIKSEFERKNIKQPV